MPLIKIKHWNGSILHTIETDNLCTAINMLVKAGASLDGASLNGASLNGANINGANLNGANIDGASLNGASLDGASLNGASLDGASLDGANLNGASLNGAKIGDLLCLSELSDAIDLAPMIFQEWEGYGFGSAMSRFGLYKIPGEDRALIAMAPLLIGGFCFVLHRREIWWWNWSCPNPETVPVLWREAE
jgi:hypothetical protein